jgi:MFS family permease
MSARAASQEIPLTSNPYMLLTLVSAAHAMTHMYAALLPLTFPFLIQEFGINYTVLGAVMGIASLAGGLLQFVFGYASRYVPRKVLIGGGNLLLGVSTAWGGWAPSFSHYAAARWTAAVVTSPQHPVGNSMVADRFGKNLRGLALAVNYAGGNAGTLLVPLIAALLIASYGWRETMFFFALPSLIVGLIVIFFIDDSPAAASKADAQSKKSLGTMVRETRALFRNRTFAFLMAASLIAAGGRGIGIVLNFIPPYLGDPVKGLGLPATNVGLIYTTLLAGSIIGPLFLGRFSDRLGARKPVVILSYVVSTLSVFSLAILSPQGWLLYLIIFVFGCAVFSESPLVQSFMSDVVPAGSRDIMFGSYFAIAFGVSALWVTLQGWLVDHFGFPVMFLTMGSSYAVAALFVLGAREAPGGGRSEATA